MFRFAAKLLRANAWDGIDAKIHLRETNSWANRVWQGVSSQFNLLKKNYKIKGVALQEWIQRYGMSSLMHSQDPVVRGAMRDIASLLDDTVQSTNEGGSFRQNEIQAFKQQYGSNRQDWLYTLSGEKRSSSKKRRKVTSSLLER